MRKATKRKATQRKHTAVSNMKNDMKWTSNKDTSSGNCTDFFKLKDPTPGMCISANMMEIFAGSCKLSRACRVQGMHVLSIDFNIGGPEHDMTKKDTMLKIKNVLKELNIRYVHFATPCNTYSQARYPRVRSKEFPSGKPDLKPPDKLLVDKSNVCTRHSFDLITFCVDNNIAWSIENPSTSLLWSTRGWQAIQKSIDLQMILVDYCRYGEPYRKRTFFYAWNPYGQHFLDGMARTCPGLSTTHTHKNLSGWGTKASNNIPTRDGSAAYPDELCKTWARLLRASFAK